MHFWKALVAKQHWQVYAHVFRMRGSKLYATQLAPHVPAQLDQQLPAGGHKPILND